MNMNCPICRVPKGEHKMDCQNRAYVKECLAPLEAEREQASQEYADLLKDFRALREAIEIHKHCFTGQEADIVPEDRELWAALEAK
jgi:hypothetical protein